LIGTGYARLIGIHWPPLQSVITFFLWALGSKTVIPGVVDAPVLSSINQTDSEAGLGKVITGVGMGGAVRREGSVDEVLELRDDNVEGRTGLRIKTGMGKLPMVVFTHGMAGMSQSYSHYLGSIASHGYLVAAVEHRDGSGPGTIVHYADGEERFVWHLKLDDLE
jgi:platelet-activating factor acetylhydrolase